MFNSLLILGCVTVFYSRMKEGKLLFPKNQDWQNVLAFDASKKKKKKKPFLDIITGFTRSFSSLLVTFAGAEVSSTQP